MIKTFVVAAIVTLPAGCSSEIPGESRLPRCEPRSHVDPARLNIDSDAEDYAVVKPCRGSIQIYIAGKTELRAIEGEVEVNDIGGEQVAAESFELEFGSIRGGMFSEVVELAPVEGYMCRELLMHVSRLACRDGEGKGIECPAVRFKTSYVFEDFRIDKDELDVCFD